MSKMCMEIKSTYQPTSAELLCYVFIGPTSSLDSYNWDQSLFPTALHWLKPRAIYRKCKSHSIVNTQHLYWAYPHWRSPNPPKLLPHVQNIKDLLFKKYFTYYVAIIFWKIGIFGIDIVTYPIHSPLSGIGCLCVNNSKINISKF